jgi:hypothetical protein
LKEAFNGKADGERLMRGLFNWIMAGYIFEIFQSIFFDKTTTCCGCFCHGKSVESLPDVEIRRGAKYFGCADEI